MQLLPYILVVISAFTHGIWNFLAKQGQNKDVFIGLSKVTETAVFLVPFLIVLAISGFGDSRWYLFALLAACFVFLNYFFLGQAYKRIDFSVAYPIARSSSLFLPILGYIFIDERLDWLGGLSIGLITVAVLGFQLESFEKQELARMWQRLMRPGIIFAFLAAFTVAAYTIWDKIAVTRIHPFLYFYSYTAITALFYLGLLRANHTREEILTEWRLKKGSIFAVAVLNTFTYLLVLIALISSKATYVGALRQLSLVIGVFLGWRFLKEPLPLPRKLSVVLLVLGSGLIAFAK
ncbi:MAG: EamA family transporter [Chloroflexota bacterium]